MVSSIFYIELFLGGLVLILAVRSYLIWSLAQEAKLQEEIYETKREYENVLKELAKNPHNSQIKDICFEKGELFYKFKIPDYFHYPITDSTSHVEYIDNREHRLALIEMDIQNILNGKNEIHVDQTKVA